MASVYRSSDLVLIVDLVMCPHVLSNISGNPSASTALRLGYQGQRARKTLNTENLLVRTPGPYK